MKEITLEELLEAGCHFGHQVTRSNPKARDFVFENRDNIQIIDLAKTKEGLDSAAAFVKSLGAAGKTLLVVGTKKQAKQIIEEEATRARGEMNDANKNKLFYITQRWIGGILTNFPEVSKNFKKMEDLKTNLASDEIKANYTKKEIGLWDKEKQRLESFYKGIAEMPGKPDAIFIIDSHMEDLAVREAHSTNVPIVAIVDTNADPYVIDYPIPANDDAVGSIKLISAHIINAFVEGTKNQKVEKPSFAKATEGQAVQPKKATEERESNSAKATLDKKAPKATKKETPKKVAKPKAKAKK